MASTEAAPALESSVITLRYNPLAQKAGYAKVRLIYRTTTPQHVRSLILNEYGAMPPYVEDVCVLIPRMQVFAILESLIPAFERLQTAKILPADAELIDFKVLDEDSHTLAYVI